MKIRLISQLLRLVCHIWTELLEKLFQLQHIRMWNIKVLMVLIGSLLLEIRKVWLRINGSWMLWRSYEANEEMRKAKQEGYWCERRHAGGWRDKGRSRGKEVVEWQEDQKRLVLKLLLPHHGLRGIHSFIVFFCCYFLPVPPPPSLITQLIL